MKDNLKHTSELKKQLEISERRFQNVAQTATDSIIISDSDSKILFFNKAAVKTFGYEEEEIIGENLTSLMPEKYRGAHHKGMERFVATGIPKLIGNTIEIEGLKKDGTIFPLELSLSAWMEDGEYLFAGIIRDITERKSVMKELELLQNITWEINQVDDFYKALKITIQKVCEASGWNYGEAWVMEEQNNFIHYAPVWYVSDDQLLEFVRQSENIILEPGLGLPGRVFQGNIEWQPDIGLTEGLFYRNKLAEKIGLRTGFGMPLKDNENVIAALVFYKYEVQHADPHVKNIILSVINQLATVLQNKYSEEKLRERELFIKQVAEFSPTIISVYDIINHKSLYVNKELVDLLGYTHAEVKAMGGVEATRLLVHPDDLKMVLNQQKKHTALKDGEISEWEFRVKHINGSFRWLQARSTVFKRNSEGKVWLILTTSIDVTERKNAQEKLKASEADLKTLNNELEAIVEDRTKELMKKNLELSKTNIDLDSFVYTASHDLKAPIVNLEGLLGALVDSLEAEGIKNGTFKEIIEMMDLSVRKFKNTIQDLADITKVQRESFEDITAVNICKIIEEVTSDMKKEISDKEVKLTINATYCPSIKFSKINLRSIIYNLLSNGIKYRSPFRKPEIEIRIEPSNEYAILTMKDNGLGIERDKLDKIFGMFKRMHSHVEGSGIGLYIVKRIIENAGGKVEVESKIGKGSTFKIYFRN